MSRLYAVIRTAEEIAAYFKVDVMPEIAVPSETIEGGLGLIVIEKDGLRLLKSVFWGFPRQTREMQFNGEPPGRIGLVADLTNPLWDRIVVDPRYRCLIPITHFANPDGSKGRKTRAWFSNTKESLIAWAGFCRNTPEFGPVFAGMTMTASELVRPFNDRMPVILHRDDYERWMTGTLDDLLAFQQRVYPPELMEMERTSDLWVKKKASGLRTPHCCRSC